MVGFFRNKDVNSEEYDRLKKDITDLKSEMIELIAHVDALALENKEFKYKLMQKIVGGRKRQAFTNEEYEQYTKPMIYDYED